MVDKEQGDNTENPHAEETENNGLKMILGR